MKHTFASRFLAIFSVLMVLSLGVSMVAAQDNVIKIASQSPLSGGQSELGTGLRNGTELAIEQLGGDLEAMGFDIQFVPFDDQATPDVGVANAQQIVADSAILGVIGHFNSGVAIPSSEVYNANDLVMISPANTNVNITDRGLPTVNRVVGRDDLQARVGAEFIAGRDDVESVYILHDTTAYGQGIAEFLRDELEVRGVSVLGFEGTEERSNFEGIIQPILALAPDLVYMGAIYDQMGVFVNQLRAAGYTGLLMGPDGLDSPVYAELAGEAGVGTYYTSVSGPASAYPAAAQFIEDFTAKFGEPPIPFAAQAYDSTAILIDAIERAVEANGGELPSRAQVAEQVRATENFEGVTGNITFDANGDPEIAVYHILEVGSSDPTEWLNNPSLTTLEFPSPLHAAEMEMMATPEATPES